MNIAVCDTSSIIRLTKGDVIDCLGLIFDRIYIPAAVRDECSKTNVADFPLKSFVTVHQVSNILPIGMGLGEREAISLAVEYGIVDIITDDDHAIQKAFGQGLKPHRSLDVLIIAKMHGYIPHIKPVLDLIKSKKERIEDELYNETLRIVGEL
jgi:predicted nucleic acid-binding protein